MNKNKIIIISIILTFLIILILIFAKNFRKDKDIIENSNSKKLKNTTIEIGENGEHVLYDSNGNEIAREQDEYMLQKYIDNPDYNPNPSY